MPIVVAHDHAIVYFEASKVSQKVGVLPNALWHIEPANLIELWRKNYRYGKTCKELIKTGFYRNFLRKKVRFRKRGLNVRNLGLYGIQSYLLLALKGIPYWLGYWYR